LRQELSGAQQQKGELETKVREQARKIENLHKEVVQAETQKVAMKAAVDEQRRRIGELEGESQTQKGTIVRQTSEIEGLTTAKKKCENELSRSTGAAEGQVREIEQLKAKEDQLMKEVEKLKEEIRRMATEHDSLLKELAEAKDLPNKSPLPPTSPKPLQPLEKATDVVELVHRVFPGQQVKQEFPPSVKKVGDLNVPDGIIAHLTRECGGNVHDRHVVDITSGSFQKETCGANPHSGAYDNDPNCAAKNAADLETYSRFVSAYRLKGIPHTRNNWICYDFKERRIMPTHYTIRTHDGDPGGSHLKSWIVETSTDGKSWREVAHEEDNKQLNDDYFTATFAVAGGGECRFIRLVNIGRNHSGRTCLGITAWEIFGGLFK
jgi:hypothetical protein